MDTATGLRLLDSYCHDEPEAHVLEKKEHDDGV
jgi:hypothetical protein